MATVAELVARLRAKKVSSVEVTRALLDRIEAAQGRLNAFITVDREGALAQAKAADARDRAGRRRAARPACPIAHKDVLDDRAALRTTCGSRMLDNFTAPYDAHVVERLARRRHGARRQDQHGRVRDGLVQRELVFRPGAQSLEPATTCPAAARAGRRRRSRRASCPPRPAPTPAARSASPRRSPASAASSRPTACARATASSRSRRASTRRARSRARAEDCALMLNAMAGHDARDSTSLDRPREDYTRDLAKPLAGLRIGMPDEYFGDGVDPDVARGHRRRARAVPQARRHDRPRRSCRT